MRRRAKVAERWTLLQALAWVLTRDQQLVDEAGAAPAAARTPFWLIVCAAPLLKGDASTGLAWRELSERIVARAVRSDGLPQASDGSIGERQLLSIEARDLVLDSERLTPGRECFLAPQAPEQRSWLSVEVNAHDVQKAFPAAGVKVRRGGRKPMYDQNNEITNKIWSLIKQHGAPGPNNKFLKSENALVEKAMDFSAILYKQAPARSTLQSIVRKAIGSFPERHGAGDRIG